MFEVSRAGKLRGEGYREVLCGFFFSSRRRHTRSLCDWSSDVCSSDLEGEFFVLMKQTNENEWKSQYRFTLKPYHYSDFAEICRYHETSSQSHFTRARICSRATTDGRITLSGLRLITSADDGLRQERILTNDEEYATILRDHFGIVMAS